MSAIIRKHKNVLLEDDAQQNNNQQQNQQNNNGQQQNNQQQQQNQQQNNEVLQKMNTFFVDEMIGQPVALQHSFSDSQLFYLEHQIDLRNETINDKMIFEQYSMYDLIVNYKQFFSL